MSNNSQAQSETLASQEERHLEEFCRELENLYEEFTESLDNLWQETKTAIEEHLQNQVALVTRNVEVLRTARQREDEFQQHHKAVRSFLEQVAALKPT